MLWVSQKVGTKWKFTQRMPRSMTKNLLSTHGSASSGSSVLATMVGGGRRVYIGNLAKDCDHENLDRDLKQYGAIEHIHLAPGNFCVVTYETDASVTLAMEDTKYAVKRAREEFYADAFFFSETEQASNQCNNGKKKGSKKPSSRHFVEALLRTPTFHTQPSHKNPDRGAALATAQTIEDGSTMLVLQCMKSHLNRVLEYLKSLFTGNLIHFGSDGGDVPLMQYLSRIPQKQNVSLVFLPSRNHHQAQQWALMLQEDVLLNNALNAVYCVAPKAQHYLLNGNTWSFSSPSLEIPDTLISQLVHQLHDCLEQQQQVERTLSDSSTPKMVVRIHTFPPQLAAKISPALLQPGILPADIDFSPKDFTHVLSVVQLTGEYTYYMTGLRRDALVLRNDRVASTIPTSIPITSELSMTDSTSNHICRAYFKLSEALTRSSKRELLTIQGKVALDCGASPGGWTKYLVEQGASHVYSIDPGALDPSILELDGVSHMATTYQEAILKLQQDGVTCDILVSDMNCKEIDDQLLNLLQLARQTNLFNHRATNDSVCTGGASWFVITLKCGLGYSEQSYNKQVQAVVQRLEKEQLAEQVEVVHLFGNRTTERTLIGLVK
jgi:23S rRNA U2552 (ribose-2'-O)-methylase RlmE/FtsJ